MENYLKYFTCCLYVWKFCMFSLHHKINKIRYQTLVIDIFDEPPPKGRKPPIAIKWVFAIWFFSFIAKIAEWGECKQPRCVTNIGVYLQLRCRVPWMRDYSGGKIQAKRHFMRASFIWANSFVFQRILNTKKSFCIYKPRAFKWDQAQVSN